MNDYIGTLRSEFNADSGSFLLTLRTEYEWDSNAFDRLVDAMRLCCEAKSCDQEYNEDELVERWLACGFWYMASFVKDWTSHPRFPKRHPIEYYENAYRSLDDLAFWFFYGESPYAGESGIEPLGSHPE